MSRTNSRASRSRFLPYHTVCIPATPRVTMAPCPKQAVCKIPMRISAVINASGHHPSLALRISRPFRLALPLFFHYSHPHHHHSCASLRYFPIIQACKNPRQLRLVQRPSVIPRREPPTQRQPSLWFANCLFLARPTSIRLSLVFACRWSAAFSFY